jgi:hypothetical protein
MTSGPTFGISRWSGYFYTYFHSGGHEKIFLKRLIDMETFCKHNYK